MALENTTSTVLATIGTVIYGVSSYHHKYTSFTRKRMQKGFLHYLCYFGVCPEFSCAYTLWYQIHISPCKFSPIYSLYYVQ